MGVAELGFKTRPWSARACALAVVLSQQGGVNVKENL